MTFTKWLLAQQDRKDGVGALARVAHKEGGLLAAKRQLDEDLRQSAQDILGPRKGYEELHVLLFACLYLSWGKREEQLTNLLDAWGEYAGAPMAAWRKEEN